MSTATVSSKVQLALPKALREAMQIQPGQQFELIPMGSIIQLVPKTSIKELRGIARGANPAQYRAGKTGTDVFGGHLRLDWVDVDSPLAKSYSRYLTSPDTLIVPTLVQHELYKWLFREIDQATALSAIATTQTARVIALDTSLALLAADTTRELKLTTADAIIYATARQHNAILVTSDAHFADLPHVKYFQK